MSVSADMYLIISLMFAVFAAVAAVGTSIVLGAGFERLRAGFEIIKRQTGFFADAIHKLDQRSQELEQGQAQLNQSVNAMSDKVERVDKQTGFFSDALHSLEKQMQNYALQTEMPQKLDEQQSIEEEVLLSTPQMVTIANDVSDADVQELLGHIQFNASGLENTETEPEPLDEQPEPQAMRQMQKPSGISTLFRNYLHGDQSAGQSEATYH